MPGPDERTRDALRVDVGGRGYALLVSCEAGVFTRLLPDAGSVEVGRDETCEVWLEDGTVSRRHLRIHLGETLRVEELGSRNGTRIGGRRLATNEVVSAAVGTVIEVGSATLVVQLASQALAAGARPRPATRERADGVVVHDPAMKRMYELLDVVAPSMLTVIILGETGVGKEVFAAEIHRRSPRATKPFLALNCAGLSETLLESELFGHERGAFTGAVRDKAGLFEAADEGTVFLDEVGELSPTTQAKLLRVLETGEFLRVGGVTPRRVDVRFVAATHRDLPSRVAEGAFRADLYFRLNGMTVTLPPLRERRSDIAPLAELFASRARATLTPAAIAELEAHTWPGNVRELRNVVERAALLAQGRPVGAEHVVIDVGPRGAPPVQAAPPSSRGLRDQVGAYERERIVEALAKTGGHQAKAAELLGISRRALIDKLDAYGIERPRKR